MIVDVLDQLDAQVALLPVAAVKDDMDPGFDAMARWIDGLSAHERAEVVAALPSWLADDRSWHERAVSEIALRLRSTDLLDAAIAHARTVGVQTLVASHGYPPWLTYQLSLLSVISRWPGDRGPRRTDTSITSANWACAIRATALACSASERGSLSAG